MAIIALTDFEHVQRKPEMYVGNTQNPIHLLYELIDNAADEVINGNASEIKVYLDYDTHTYSVSDNGRGIPITSPTLKNEAPIVIATTLRSGGKFDNELYSYHSGLHGMGLAIVNALSESMSIDIIHGTKHYSYKFKQSENPKDVVRTVTKITTHPYSTLTSFTPSAKMFDTLDIDESTVIDRLKGILISVKGGLDIYLITTKNGVTSTLKIENTFMDEYTNKENQISFTLTGTRTDDGGAKYTDSMVAYIGFEESYKYSKFFSIVNTLPITDGNHKRFLESAIKEFMWDYATKTNRHVKKEDMLLGSNMFCILTLSNPAFASQDKKSLTGKTGKYSHLLDKDKLFKILRKNTEFFDKWLDYCESFRTSKDAKETVSSVKKTRNRVAVEGLRDCSSSDVKERELYIVEGKSAGGTLLRARDTRIHAILPLRGKILNVLNASYESIQTSKSLECIFKSIGVAAKESDLSKIRYNKIIIATDSDYDGLHIRALLLSFFDRFAVSLIKNHKLFIAHLPLYGCDYKGKFTPINTKEELEKYRKLKCDIHRYKGLGEMDAAELGPCMFDPNIRILTQVEKGKDGRIKEIWGSKADLIKDFVEKG